MFGIEMTVEFAAIYWGLITLMVASAIGIVVKFERGPGAARRAARRARGRRYALRAAAGMPTYSRVQPC